MRASGPFQFSSPLVEKVRGLASDAMQKWMITISDFVGGEYQAFTPTSYAPGYLLVGFTYRLTAGDCQVNVAFNFTGDGVTNDITLTLPVPAFNHFAQFPCFANATGQPLQPQNCAVYADGLVHVSQPQAVPWPNGANIYVQFSGRYRISA